MSKYIPKVGEAFEFYSDVLKGWYDRPKVLLITDKEVVYLGDNGRIAGLCLTRTFRPIQTKSDVEREQLYGFFNDASNFGHSDEWLINKIQESNFTIPNKVKRSDVYNAVESFVFPMAGIGLTGAICELLGDLVEQDEKGGVE
jgi:hypothetical protein